MSERRDEDSIASEREGRGTARGSKVPAGDDEKAPRDEVEEAGEPTWSLAAAVPASGREASAAFEMLRELSPEEFSALGAARDLLSQLTVISPHQVLVQRYERLAEALEELAGDSSESHDARLARVQKGLRTWASHAADLPAAVEGMYGPLLRDRTMAALDRWRAGELSQVCRELADAGSVRATQDGELVAELPGSQPDRSARLISVHKLLAVALGNSERLHFQVLLDAEPELHEASRLLRGLEGEVLLGRPMIMRMSGSQAQMQGLHEDVRAIAETAVRAARDSLTRLAASGPGDADRRDLSQMQVPVAQVDAAADIAFGDDNASGSGAAPDATVAAPTAADPTAADGTGPDPADPPRPSPPVDVAAVASLLSASVSRLEEVWVDAVAPDEVMSAAEMDTKRFGGVVAALMQQSEQAEQALRGTGMNVIPHFPLARSELAALDPERPAAPGPHAWFLPQLYVLQDFLSEIGTLSQPVSITLGPGGAIKRVAFDPGAVERMKAKAELLGRCARVLDLKVGPGLPVDGAPAQAHADPPAAHSTGNEMAWLRRAAIRASDAGLPEAVVLYCHLLAAAGDSSDPALDELAAELCRQLVVSGAAADDALPVTVPLAQHLVSLLVGGDLDPDGDDTRHAPHHGQGTSGAPASMDGSQP